jgi:hypothetical protein
MGRWRVVLAVAGILLGLFGVGRLVTQVPVHSLIGLAVWLVAALIIHDGIASPLVIAVGALLARVPPRGRRYLQAGMITGAMITVIAVPMIVRQDSQPVSKAILSQHYGSNLSLLLGLVAVGTLVAYAVRVARDQSRPDSASASDPGVDDHAR